MTDGRPQRVVFVLRIAPVRAVDEARVIHSLKNILKALLRRHGWRALSVIRERDGGGR